MTKPNDEDLIGYLLGALDPDQRADLERQLEKDPHLCRRLYELDDQLQALRLLEFDESDPPADLAERTCAAIEAYEEARQTHPPSSLQTRSSDSRCWSFVDMRDRNRFARQ